MCQHFRPLVPRRSSDSTKDSDYSKDRQGGDPIGHATTLKVKGGSLGQIYFGIEDPLDWPTNNTIIQQRLIGQRKHFDNDAVLWTNLQVFHQWYKTLKLIISADTSMTDTHAVKTRTLLAEGHVAPAYSKAAKRYNQRSRTSL